MRAPSYRLILCFAAALSCAPLAHAQTNPPGQPATATTPKLNLTMENEHTLKEILLKDQKIKREAGQTELKAGDSVPQSVALQEFPTEIAEKIPQIKAHRFFIAGDKIVIVRPQERKVDDVVK